MTHLFTYGSLMCNDIMARVAGYHPRGLPATLVGYHRSRVRNEEYPGIFPQPGCQVKGILYLDIPPRALERLDQFEGDYYHRSEVDVVGEDTTLHRAMTYIIKHEYQALLTNEEWSYADFLAVGKTKFLQDYLGFYKI